MDPATIPSVEVNTAQRRIYINTGDYMDLRDLGTSSEHLLPYKLIKILGSGGSGVVEMVEDVDSCMVYARKTLKIVNKRDMERAIQKLKNEVEIMQRLAAHHHVIRVHATYVLKRQLAIILAPVADGGDLTNFLNQYRDRGFNGDMVSLEENSILQKSFGCLASGLAFMHRYTVRHKDIKPQNILVHDGSVLYTDFGVSYEYGSASQSNTTGQSSGYTKRFCAPEVAKGTSRNTKADVFSLGCVFIEIIAAMWPAAISDEMLHARPYHENDMLLSGQGILLDLVPPLYAHRHIIKTREMLRTEPSARPTAHQIACSFQDTACTHCSTLTRAAGMYLYILRD